MLWILASLVWREKTPYTPSGLENTGTQLTEEEMLALEQWMHASEVQSGDQEAVLAQNNTLLSH